MDTKKSNIQSSNAKLLYFTSCWETKQTAQKTENYQSKQLYIFTENAQKDEWLRIIAQQKQVAKVTIIINSEDTSEIAENIYGVPFTCNKSISELFQQLKAKGNQASDILFHATDSSAKTKQRFDENYNDQLNSSFIPLFNIIQASASVKNKSLKNLLYVTEKAKKQSKPHIDAAAGLANSLKLIFPGLSFKTAYTDGPLAEYQQMLIPEIWQPSQTIYSETLLESDKKLYKNVKEVSLETDKSIFRPEGVYIIIGGAGAIGLITARYIIDTYGATVILTGRSKLTAEKQRIINSLDGPKGKVVYFQCDSSNLDSFTSTVNSVLEKYKKINGIIHSAASGNDDLIINKTIENFTGSLEAKVKGTIVPDLATKDIKLDFFMLFSSTSSVLGDFGQCDYALGNRFQDAYVEYRNQLCNEKKRSGKTLAINWPLWKDGGLHLDKDAEELYLASSGMEYLESTIAMEAMEAALSSELSQVMVIVGDPEKVKTFLLLNKTKKTTALPTKQVTRTTHSISKGRTVEENLKDEIAQIVCKLLEISKDKIDYDANLSYFGFDSISLKDFSAQLGSIVEDEISPTVFFAHSNINALTSYLCEEYPDQIKNQFSPQVQEQENITLSEPVLPTKTESFSPLSNTYKRLVAAGSNDSLNTTAKTKDIAVIGISGLYPQSDSLAEFWERLANEENMIVEVPAERWNWHEYFGDPYGNENKTFSKWGGFINKPYSFDNQFFKLSPKEAEMMDPQQRLLLQTAWSTIEDAGYKPSDFSGKDVGVFVGTQFNDYQHLLSQNGELSPYVSTGNANSLLANRISYLLNFHGPSESLDTACSSSLVAIIKAVNSIRANESALALAGGVSLMLSPESMISANKLGVLSPNGRCKTFDKDADGYVKGEGIGAVLLKPLEDALKDNDNIYAVIRGLAENHGGKANSLTAPNSKAQASLIKKAIADAGVPADSISYIEMHGTGTALGDPVEIDGIKQAFDIKDSVSATKRLGLGSIKTNIGHLEPASGIAGFTKIVLAMKNRKIPGTLHLENLNPYVKIENTPLYIVDRTRNWETPLDESGKPAPMRAGVSSFGFGGANAHILLEESPLRQNSSDDSLLEEQFVVLSALNYTALQKQAQNLLEHICKLGEDSLHILNRIAYTLQTGREAFNCRLAIAARSIAEVRTALEEISASVISSNKFIRNNPNANSYPEIEAWVSGKDFQWGQLYQTGHPQRISLPSYPFADNHLKAEFGQASISGSVSELHPLVHQNTSTLNEQRFTSVFKGNEFFFKDHIINNNRILPGSAYLEIATQCGAIAMDEKVTCLSNFAWFKPVMIDHEAVKVQIGLYPEDDSIHFNLYSTDDEAETVYSEGKIRFHANIHTEPLNLETIQKRCTQIISNEECYSTFRSMGYNYGPSFQTIQQIKHSETEAISHLKLKAENSTGYILHPALLDGAFQTTLAIYGAVSARKPNTQFVPFAIDEVSILKPIESECYAHAVVAEGEQENVKKFNITIVDRSGNVLISVKNLYVRAFTAEKTATQTVSQLFLENSWEERAVEVKQARSLPAKIAVFGKDDELQKTFADKQAQTFLIKRGKQFKQIQNSFELRASNSKDFIQLFDVLKKETSLPELIIFDWFSSSFAANTDYCQQELQDTISPVFHITKYFALHKQLSPEIIIPIKADEESHPLYVALTGYIKTLVLEEPALKVKIQLHQSKSVHELSNIIRTERNCRSNTPLVKYAGGIRFEKHLKAIRSNKPAQAANFKDKGVYLITGGMGGIGKMLALRISSIAKCTIILCGRTSVNQIDKQFIKGIEQKGCTVEYIQADICSLAETQKLHRQISNKHGQLNGIIHSAGIVKDGLIAKKEFSDFIQVASPKISGTLNLNEVTKTDALDFFVLFSSTSSVFGNFGQADYAFANSFLDNFAAYRTKSASAQQYRGRTICINWPLWESAGMNIDEKFIAYYKEQYGFVPLSDEAGMDAFEQALSNHTEQQVILNGYKHRIENFINKLNSATAEAEANTISKSEQKTASPELHKAVTVYLQELMAELLKMDHNDIDVNEHFESYGIDSIMIMTITRSLEAKFGELSKTLFFEYQNISELASYFTSKHGDKANELFNIKAVPQATSIGVSATENKTVASLSKTAKRSRFIQKQQTADTDEIAIIGVSGRYPQASNIDEFLQNLLDSKDCITEIPIERWDYRKDFETETDAFGRQRCIWGGFIDDVDKFDSLFFKISPREAELLDPQERIYLQTAWHAIEDAGYSMSSLSAKAIGNFVGVMYGHYQLFGSQERVKGNHITPSSSYASIANRVSYFLNLKGPSLALDTMCSSSLTSVHLACQSIRNNECEMAIAGGVNVSIHPYKYDYLSQGGFLSDEGKCRAFGEGGSGYVPGEGVGCIILKPLSKAVADGDNIYAVVKASMLNHGGKANGYTVPNPNAQAQLITETLQRAHISPRNISYIETHGTGTALGDPIEITGLTKVFEEDTDKKQFCPIGSVKSNIGHLESAAGIASITKVLLQMKHKLLFPSIHSKVLNPNINFAETPFYVQQEIEKWEKPHEGNNDIPRTACISAFGAGGSNAHLVLQEYEGAKPAGKGDNNQHIFTFSAKNRKALENYCHSFVGFIEKQTSRQTSPNISVSASNVSLKLFPIIAQAAKMKDSAIKADMLLWEFSFSKEQLNRLLTGIRETFNLTLAIEFIPLHKSLEAFSLFIAELYEKQLKSEALNRIHHAVSLTDMAYTLQCGREMFDERLAIVASSIDELRASLTKYLAGTMNAANIVSNQDSKNAISLKLDSTTQEKIVSILIQQNQMKQVASLWVAGENIDWGLLYKNSRPQKISLPTYQFAKERYWVNTVESTAPSVNTNSIQSIHPFIDRNLSNLYEFAFSKSFKKEDEYISKHHLSAQNTLSPLFFLEMIRKSAEILNPKANSLQFEKIRWAKPAHYGNRDQLDFTIKLFPDKNVVFEIINTNINKAAAQGLVSYPEFVYAQNVELPDFVNDHDSSISGSDLYRELSQGASPIQPYYQTIKQVYAKGAEMLSIIDASINEAEKGIVLIHPKLVDAIEQTIQLKLAELNLNSYQHSIHAFSLDKLIVAQHTENAHAIHIKEIKTIGASIIETEATVLDTQNNVLLKIEGFKLYIGSTSKTETITQKNKQTAESLA